MVVEKSSRKFPLLITIIDGQKITKTVIIGDTKKDISTVTTEIGIHA